MNHAVMSKPLYALSALCLMALAIVPVRAQDENNADRGRPAARRLTVTGQGEIKSKPDKADITIGVVTENKSSSVAAKENATASQRVQNAIKQLGVAEKDIQTVNYSIQPLMVYPQPNQQNVKPQITGYRVYNQVRITVRDLPKMGDVLDAATNAGSNTIEGIAFGLQESTATEDQALEKAVKDARRKADRMVMAAGAKIVGVYEINEGVNVRPVPMMFGRAAAVADAASTPIAPGELTTTANVTIVYEIEKTLSNARLDSQQQTARR